MAAPPNKELKRAVKQGKAMPAPGQDRPGRFPVRNEDDLAKAIRAVGRVKPATEEARAKVRRFIIKRARALNLLNRIPDDWNADGTLKSK